MKNFQTERVLSISPCSLGFGFAVLEGSRIVGWGIKNVRKGDKNDKCIEHLIDLLAEYLPKAVVIEDYSAKGSRRSPRVRKLLDRVVELGSDRKMRVYRISRLQVNKWFFRGDRSKTKHDIAQLIVKQFPQELGPLLPPKRRAWTSEGYWTNMFDALAFGMAQMKTQLAESGV